jgi:hypothetical protein
VLIASSSGISASSSGGVPHDPLDHHVTDR